MEPRERRQQESPREYVSQSVGWEGPVHQPTNKLCQMGDFVAEQETLATPDCRRGSQNLPRTL